MAFVVARAGADDGYVDLAAVTWADTERGRGPAGTAIREQRTVVMRDLRANPAFAPWLEEAVKHSETMFAQWITEEANAAAEIKKTKPIMVVLGNPPYRRAR